MVYQVLRLFVLSAFNVDYTVGLLKVRLVATLLGNSCSPGSKLVLCLVPFLCVPISFPFDVVGGILNSIVSVPDHCPFTFTWGIAVHLALH